MDKEFISKFTTISSLLSFFHYSVKWTKIAHSTVSIGGFCSTVQWSGTGRNGTVWGAVRYRPKTNGTVKGPERCKPKMNWTGPIRTVVDRYLPFHDRSFLKIPFHYRSFLKKRLQSVMNSTGAVWMPVLGPFVYRSFYWKERYSNRIVPFKYRSCKER